jgi:hypothetical protein
MPMCGETQQKKNEAGPLGRPLAILTAALEDETKREPQLARLLEDRWQAVTAG